MDKCHSRDNLPENLGCQGLTDRFNELGKVFPEITTLTVLKNKIEAMRITEKVNQGND
jgi:hypothetical protein